MYEGNWRDQATVTVPEAGGILGIGRSAAYAAANRGELPTVRLGCRLLVPVARLRRLLGEIEGVSAEREPA